MRRDSTVKIVGVIQTLEKVAELLGDEKPSYWVTDPLWGVLNRESSACWDSLLSGRDDDPLELVNFCEDLWDTIICSEGGPEEIADLLIQGEAECARRLEEHPEYSDYYRSKERQL